MGHRVVGSATPLEAVDIAIIRALQSDGRASWPQIAQIVGCSSSTARRRFDVLHSAGLVRVVGVPDVARMRAGVPSMALLSGTDAASPVFLDQLSRRNEIRFLSSAIGAAGAIAEVVVERPADLHAFVREVTRGFAVGFESFMVAHMYTTSQDWLMRPEDRRVFRDPGTTEFATLTAMESIVLAELVHNARVGNKEIAERVHRSEATVRRTVESLESRGLLSYSVLVEPETMGYGVEFYIWLQVAPESLRQVGEALAEHPATKYLAATTGRFQLVGQIVLGDAADLYSYLADVVGGLPGVTRLETMLQTNTRKRIQKRVVDGTYVDDSPTPQFTEF